MRRVKGLIPKAILAATALSVATAPMAWAQDAPTGKPTPLLAPPQAVIQPLPGEIVAPLPTLAAAQTAQLRQLLGEVGKAQGLRRVDSKLALPSDNDGLIRATLDYARSVHSGRLAEDDFQQDWGMRPDGFDPMPGFVAAVRGNQLSRWIASLPPPYSGYEGLKSGLDHYRQIELTGGWKDMAAGPDLAIGSKGARVAALRARLRIEDSLVAATGDSFDAGLDEAVKRAQHRYGLNPSGLVSKQTLAALNVPVRDRIHQIMANMERWRWLPQELPAKRIQVNIAAAVLTVFDGDQPIASMKAVTGAPGTETPMLSSTIHSIVINPPWNVPTSIATRELWPKEKASPGYLKRNSFKVIDLGNGATRLQQAAGSASALGRFKFDFPNDYAVYLHDTPAQAAFGRFDRLASHGCIRLAKPAQLAELLLRGSETWDAQTIADAVDKGETVRAQLPEPVAVFLLYWTAYASADGSINFREDPYDWDGKLAAKIEQRADTQQMAAK